jgi:hypothetical protein
MFIKYDQETGSFFTNLQAPIPKPKQEDNQRKSKKKASVRTVVTKANERIINEEVLSYIVTKLQEDKAPTIDKSDKEECIDKIKNKLLLKKLTANDKVLIGKKYEEIYNVVVANN